MKKTWKATVYGGPKVTGGWGLRPMAVNCGGEVFSLGVGTRTHSGARRSLNAALRRLHIDPDDVEIADE